MLALLSYFSTFSFKLFGIFVNISNKIPPLLKAGGTLATILKNRTKLKFGIAKYSNLTQEQNDWVNDLSIELKSFFENKNYGEDLKELYFGLITVKPEFDQFFKEKKPRYRPGERTSMVDGFEIKSNNCAEIDCKIEFNKISQLNKAELLKKVCEEIITASDSLTRLSKLKKFDYKSYKTDLESYLIEKKYINQEIL